MTDEDLIAVLKDWPYMGETYAEIAADRIKDLLKFSSYWHNRAEALEAKLAKVVEALNIVDLSIMNNTGGIEWLLWGEETVSGIRTVMAELGEK